MGSKRCMEIEEGSHSKSSQQPVETNNNNVTIKMPQNSTSDDEVIALPITCGSVTKLSSFAYNVMIALIIIIICTVSLPVLIVTFVVTRVLQLLRRGDAYDDAVKLKLLIRAWIFAGMTGLVVILAIVYGFIMIFSKTSTRETLETRIHVFFVVFGIYFLNWVLSVLTFKFTPNVPLDNSESGLNITENVLEIIDSLSLWLAFTYVSSADSDLLYNISEVSFRNLILVVITCNVIVLCSRLLVKFLKFVCGKLDPGSDKMSRRYLFMEKIMHIRYVMYCANGLKQNFDFLCCSFVILLTWGEYFERLGGYQGVSITCLCLFLFAILRLIKTCLSMSWEVGAIYNRLEPKIVEGAKQLYFLGIMGRRSHDIFNLLYRRKTDTNTHTKDIIICLVFNIFPINLINIEAKYHKKEDQQDGSKDGQGDNLYLSTKMRNKVKGDLLLKKGGRPSLYDMQQIVQYFLQAKETLKNDNYISDILDKLKTSLEHQDSNNGSLPKGKLRELIEAGMKDNNEEDGEIWNYFEQQMHEYATEESSKGDTIDIDAIEDWMERARCHCLFLANTLASAKEVVRCLNDIISWLLIAAIIILWLLLTGFTTTKVLVVFASPLLAASFMFGESCKTWFKGIIFAYVVHPFDVGDLCIIDDVMMEVRIIGVWITTFSKVDKLEEVIYPNSQLLNKKITNHKINFDWNDSIVLGVARLNYDQIMNVKNEIKKYLNDNKDKMSDGFVEVFLGNDVDMKITVTFTHNVEMKDKTYYQCHKRKQQLRSELVDHLQNIVKHNTKTRDTDSIDQ